MYVYKPKYWQSVIAGKVHKGRQRLDKVDKVPMEELGVVVFLDRLLYLFFFCIGLRR